MTFITNIFCLGHSKKCLFENTRKVLKLFIYKTTKCQHLDIGNGLFSQSLEVNIGEFIKQFGQGAEN